jgi:hypothetical protein
MRLVIDSNQLQSARLAKFLSRSSSNQAVLTDFVAMEAYKGDSLNSIFKSMEIVSAFPSQVLILKGSRKLFGVLGKPKGLQRRLIDESQTHGFEQYIRKLKKAHSGDLKFQQAILAHGKASDTHFKQMMREAAAMRETLAVMAKELTKEERAALRARESYPPELTNKVVRSTIEIAANIAKSSGLVHLYPTYEHLPNTYYFRVALACYLMGITRAAHSDITSMRPDKLRNDLVDMTIVAAASFFDGILSEDARVNDMYAEVCLLLSGALGAQVPYFANMQKSEP